MLPAPAITEVPGGERVRAASWRWPAVIRPAMALGERPHRVLAGLILAGTLASVALAQPWAGPPASGGGQGPGGPGGPGQQKVKLVKSFDRDGDGWLNTAERQVARASLNQGGQRRGPGGPGGPPGGPGGDRPTPQPGARIAKTEVAPLVDVPLYAPNALRTLFLDFAETDWEKELEDFHGTDVDVPATLTVDAKAYYDVGVRFRGSSSYFMVGTGYKRSLNLSLDMAHKDQKLQGHATLNLLNSHEDPSFLRTVLCLEIARQYLPVPQANLVRLVINGENWGVYVNLEQFDKEFVARWFGTRGGARWKVPGSPDAQGSLAYLGDNAAAYKGIYEIKSKDEPQAWADLVEMCRVLNETPAADVETALATRLDIDGALKFLALENVLINNDGYWIRSSDYSLYEDESGRFHVFPADVNETFSTLGGPGGPGGPGGRGGRGGPGSAHGPPPGGPPPNGFGRPPPGGGPPGRGRQAGGVALDPLVSAKDTSRPLAAKLLAVPALRARYLQDVRDIAETWLDWTRLGPLATQYHALIADAVEADTRKLASSAAFRQSLEGAGAETERHGPGGPAISLKSFAEQRRAFLLGNAEVKGAAKQVVTTQKAPAEGTRK
jgi:hypothetical protein